MTLSKPRAMNTETVGQEGSPATPQQRARVLGSRYFWIVVAMLGISSFFHYLGPQTSLLPLSVLPLTRYTVGRIIFLLPVAAAAYAFGYVGGLITLALATLIMLPRVFLVSSQPLDALIETVGITLVGLIIVWMIETQDREKKLRQHVVEELETVNAISAALCQSLDLDLTLDTVLGEVLAIVPGLGAKGAIFLLDSWGQTLHMRAYRGLPEEFVQQASEIPLEECLCGLTAETNEVLVVADALDHPRHARCLEQRPHSHVCVPLHSKDRLQGIMDFCLPGSQSLDNLDRQLFATIGGQIGVAVENSRLYENLRFYVRQITLAQEEERKRVARELHDDTAQGLIDLSRRLDDLAASGEVHSEYATERLEVLQERIEDLLQGVRRYGRDLRPSVLDDLGLLPALEGLLANVRESGVEAELRIDGEQRRLYPEAELELFRIVQEALHNVRWHAQASRVLLEIRFGPDRVRVSVQDDGRGFEVLGTTSDLASKGKFGLVGITERAKLLGGQSSVHSELGIGTAVTVDVPA
jgi:signal transduction histidine kinase